MLVMKLLKKLVALLSFAVAGVLLLGVFHDWWSYEYLYYSKNTFGRGVRKLSAVDTVNSTAEQQKNVWKLPATIAVNYTTQQKSTRSPLPTKSSTTKITKASNFPSKQNPTPGVSKKVPTSVKRRPPTFKHLSVVGVVPKRNTSAANLYVANAMLKSRSMNVVKKERVVRILLVTYFRGGSTFLGDILQQNWKTFYHFEPLHYMSQASRINKTQMNEAFDLLSSLYRCKFDNLTRYIKWVIVKRHQFLFRRNLFLWSLCHIHPYVCFMPHYLREICLRSPVQVMKVTRLYLNDALEFVKSNQDLKIKIIYLTRDPRGIFNSRRVLDWCKEDGECNRSKNLCKDISLDTQHLKNDSEYFKWLRYEDVCLHPENVSRSLYSWLGIPYTTGVSNFLRSHTKAKKVHSLDPYSTRRNTSTAAFEWLNRLSLSEIQDVQTNCKTVMRILKYKAVGNSTYLEKDGPESVLEMPP